jgi:AraC family transcriptional regulator, transcriptional activator of the genes for pyochelin and ferripyochelin receptors
MGFEVKNDAEDSVFKQHFNEESFDTNELRAEAINVNTPYGVMNASTWYFDGIKISYAASELTQTAELDWVGDTELVTMHFNLQGKVSLFDKDLPRAFELADNQHNMFYGKEAQGKMKLEGISMRSFLIQFSRASFFNIAKDGNDAIKRFADNVASSNAAAFSDKNLEIDARLQQCIQAILNCQYADPLKRMFFFSKTMEMLVLQAEAFDRSFNNKPNYIKSDYDRERILYVRDYLLENIDSPPTLTELSRKAGLNEYKLKRAFKETFDKTVFEYLSDVRLETAKNDLLEHKKTVTEIALGLGYSSLQHFSMAFKKKFGVSPNKMK